jgi:hypothetical protein
MDIERDKFYISSKIMYFEINKMPTFPSFCSFVVVSKTGDCLVFEMHLKLSKYNS